MRSKRWVATALALTLVALLCSAASSARLGHSRLHSGRTRTATTTWLPRKPSQWRRPVSSSVPAVASVRFGPRLKNQAQSRRWASAREAAMALAQKQEGLPRFVLVRLASCCAG